MCGIFGALFNLSSHDVGRAETYINSIARNSNSRGRDGFGYSLLRSSDTVQQLYRFAGTKQPEHRIKLTVRSGSLIGNTRAEPTTEYLAEKHTFDQQPYSAGGWHIVHNGTIANDKALRTGYLPTTIDSAAIAEQLQARQVAPGEFDEFVNTVRILRGSFAILAHHSRAPDSVYVACNYRPVWVLETPFGVFFASSRHIFHRSLGTPHMLPPYSAASYRYTPFGLQSTVAPLWQPQARRKALVVCSGGLDSVVAATAALRDGMEVELIHFQYGSRAQTREVVAVQQVAEHLGIPCRVMALPVYKPSDSPLLQADSKLAGGEAGAEFAHEWVPARNLLLLSVAAAVAEAGGFDTLVLGNNMEEAGAYPDNEPEFIDRFNDLLPHAVGANKTLKVDMPVGNLMKHEIVALGLRLGAPLHLTWSCYRAGELHCGRCGPCYMRKRAFEINNADEVIQYEQPTD